MSDTTHVDVETMEPDVAAALGHRIGIVPDAAELVTVTVVREGVEHVVHGAVIVGDLA
jgi:hypothetical protein